MNYSIVVSQTTWDTKFLPFAERVRADGAVGARVKKGLAALNTSGKNITPEQIFSVLVNTKSPQFYAEMELAGDGSDWTPAELSILGDISMALPVTIYDNGFHHTPVVHQPPLEGTLLYTPGALLCNGQGVEPCDLNEVTANNHLDPEGYFNLYERRLLPVLCYANDTCQRTGKSALITVPGLGCGVFAGEYHGILGEMLGKTIRKILEKHIKRLPSIQAIYYDPYSTAHNEQHQIEHLSYLIRPLQQGNENKPQLCTPQTYAEGKDDFSQCSFYSIVAWDHVSWPGNDYWIGARATDDGVKAAATNTMQVMTGIEGFYDDSRNCYQPPESYRYWSDVVLAENLTIETSARLLF